MNKAIKFATRLLAVAFFSIGCYALSHFLFLTEWILFWPMYYRLVTPFYYLIAPCIYLYVYQVLRIDYKPPKYWWLHLIPAFIMVIDILPWIFVGYAARYEAVRSIVVDHDSIFEVARGFLPIWIHFVARPLLGLIYLFFQFRYIFRVRTQHKHRFHSRQYERVYKWILILTGIELIMYLSLTSFTIAMSLNLHDAAYLIRIVYFPAILMCLSFISSAFYLYFTPSLLYGYELVPYRLTLDKDRMLPIGYLKPGEIRMHKIEDSDEIPSEKIKNDSASSDANVTGMSLSPYSRDAIEKFKVCLEEELWDAELFKRQGLTVHQLTKMCGIPSRALSFMLTNIYKKGSMILSMNIELLMLWAVCVMTTGGG